MLSTHAKHGRIPCTSCTQATLGMHNVAYVTHIKTRAHTHTHTCARTRKICFQEPSILRKNTVIAGISKLKGWLILEVRYLDCKSMKLKKIQLGFQEYDFNFKISNRFTRITCFTFFTFLLLTTSFLRIFYFLKISLKFLNFIS